MAQVVLSAVGQQVGGGIGRVMVEPRSATVALVRMVFSPR